MVNFVKFITDEIRPATIDAYLSSVGTTDEFVGSDSSTADYTKFGWIASVYRNMLRANTVTPEVTAIVSQIAKYESDEAKNYELKSPSGFTIADTMVYDARNDPAFSINAMNDAIGGGDFNSFFYSIVGVPSRNNSGSALHMMIEYNLDIALVELPASVFIRDGSDYSSTQMSPLLYALKRAADEDMTGPRKVTYNIVKTKSMGGTYLEIFGDHPTSTGTGQVQGDANEIIKFLLSVDADTAAAAASQILDMVGENAILGDAMVNSINTATGINKNSIDFDIGVYDGLVNTTNKNKGYNPLFYFVNRYKRAINIETLATLAEAYSPYTISLIAGETEGFNVIGMIAYYLTLENGEWAQPDLAAWLKSTLEGIPTEDEYVFFAAAGDVRDFTKGKSANSFGVVSNIFRSINQEHSAYNSAMEEGDDPFDPSLLISQIFPAYVGVPMYNEWMVEFGQEVD